MKVKIAKSLDVIEEFDLKASTIKEVLNGVKFYTSKEYTDEIISNKYKYILVFKDMERQPVALLPEVILSVEANEEIDYLLIIKDIEGEIAAPAVAVFLYGAGAVTAAGALAVTGIQLAITYAVTALINIAISIALNMIMSLLSPTKEFSADPAEAQKKNSNLFNGAPLVREQGGSVPLAYGYGFAGGVLLSSSITTVEL